MLDRVFHESELPYRRARRLLGAVVAVGPVGLGMSAPVAPRPMPAIRVGDEAAALAPARVLGRAPAGRDRARGAFAAAGAAAVLD